MIQTLKEEELGQEDLNARFLSEYPGPEHASLPAVHSKAGMPQAPHCTPALIFHLWACVKAPRPQACFDSSHPQQRWYASDPQSHHLLCLLVGLWYVRPPSILCLPADPCKACELQASHSTHTSLFSKLLTTHQPPPIPRAHPPAPPANQTSAFSYCSHTPPTAWRPCLPLPAGKLNRRRLRACFTWMQAAC